MNVNDIVQERIQVARNRIAANKRRRDELNAARRRGLVARHAAKLRNLDAADRRRAAAEKGFATTETPGGTHQMSTPDGDDSVANPDGIPDGCVTAPDATPDGSIRPTDATPDLAAVRAQLERIADRLEDHPTTPTGGPDDHS